MTSFSTGGGMDDTNAEEVFEDYLARVSSGEAVDFDALCDSHADIAGTLRDMKTLFSAVGQEGSANHENQVPQQIGPYHLRETLGEGGMGTVYLAEQVEPVRRRVALKIIKLGMDSKAILQRFEQERQALALMDHDGIARVYDCGATDSGQPYFVMELIKGVPIDEFCEQSRLSLQDRLKLIQRVCAAVQHAHQKGVVHRDLKPGNVLVTSNTGGYQIKIIDFGLAKAMGGKLIQQSLVSEVGLIIGTSAYMAPEQANPSNIDIDTRADIYSIGVLLYQVLVGELPFSVEELQEVGFAGMQRILREVAPPKPSTKLTTVGLAADQIAERRRVSLSALRKALKTDLDWVVLKALDKDRNRRYSSATALAEDLQRFLDHEPLVAGPPSAFYQMQKLLSRYRGQFVAALLFVVTLLAGGISSFVLWQEAKQRAQDNAKLATDNLTLAENNALIAEQKSQLAEQNLELASSERLAKEQAEASATEARRGEERAKASAAAERAVTEFVQEALVSSDPNQGGEQAFLVVEAMDQAIAQLKSRQNALQPETQARLLRTIANILNGNARSHQALELAKQELNIFKTLHEGDHSDVATSLTHVASCQDQLGSKNEALQTHAEALAMRQRLFEGDHPTILESLNNHAACLKDLGRNKDALAEFEEALSMALRLFPRAHQDLASTINNYAACLKDLGRLPEALQQFEEALAMKRQLSPGGDPSVARSLNNVATCLQSLHRDKEALSKYEEALAMMQRLFEGNHPLVAIVLNNLANCLNTLGQHEEALRHSEQALAMRRGLFEGDHPSVSTSLNIVAYCLETNDRKEDALQKYQEALAMRQRLFEGDHPYVATSLNNVAFCLEALGRNKEALPKYEEALAIQKRLAGGDHPDVVVCTLNLAVCLMRVDVAEQALAHAIEAHAMALRVFPEGHPMRKHSTSVLAKIREAAHSKKQVDR
jgi:eukaryotic-like serine/threonine-protein kinase